MEMSDIEAADAARRDAIIARAREKYGPGPFESVLEAARALPEDWRRWSAGESFQFLRCELRFTQEELAEKAGLAQSQVSRAESGADARLSTWQKIYAAMGFRLLLVPLTDRTLGALEVLAERGRPRGSRLRSKPRRRPPGALWPKPGPSSSAGP